MNETIATARRRLSVDGEPIYRPTRYPFEMESASGYIIQTRCFVDESPVMDSRLIAAAFIGDVRTGEETRDPLSAQMFDTREDAVNCMRKHCAFAAGDDGNVYPRVIKVRLSCIVEGVVFESVVRDVKSGDVLEEVRI